MLTNQAPAFEAPSAPARALGEPTPDDADFTSELRELIPSLRSCAKQLCRDHEAAADLVQETLANAWQARRTYRQGTNLKAWVFTIMRNKFRSDARRGWRQLSWDQESAEQIPAPADEQLWTVELSDTMRALKRLSSRQREAVILVGLGGVSNETAASAFKCRPSAVKSRVSRARQVLRAILRGDGPRLQPRLPGGDAVAGILAQLQEFAPLMHADAG